MFFYELQKNILIIAGSKGSGKTTTAKSIFSEQSKELHMPSKNNMDFHEALLEAHRKGVEQAIDLSIRTGTPLVVEENGRIRKIKPKYKYI